MQQKVMAILVTGGAGYIGSHTARRLCQSGFDVIIIDNLSTGHRATVESVLKVPFIEGNVGNKSLMEHVLLGLHPSAFGMTVDAVIHFAASAYVGESNVKPSFYYENNVVESLFMLQAIQKVVGLRGGKQIPIVFSSSCATYGSVASQSIPISEDCTQCPVSPYGWSKLMVERIINDFGVSYQLPYAILRYFNAGGADATGDLGELHIPETHIIPLMLDAIANQGRTMEIFGGDYHTPDGTCIRDYVHVVDLADAHVLALEHLLLKQGQSVYNLGSGRGSSIKEVIRTVEKVTGMTLKWKYAERRVGDPACLVASAAKAERELLWKPRHSHLETIVRDAWNWHQKRTVS